MDAPSDSLGSSSLSPSRIVYHRGGYIYARWKAGGPNDYRHPLDVPNGRACGCVCDECGEDLVAKANLEGKIYEKEPHFAHQTHTRCQPSGERGLLEAFRLVLEAKRRFVLPEARFTLQERDVLYQVAVESEITAIAVAPRETGTPHELHLTTPKGMVRLWVVPKKLAEAAVLIAKKQDLPVVLAFIHPDYDGAIFMRDVLHVVNQGTSMFWVHYPEMERHATEERMKRDAEAELRRQEQERKYEEMLHATEERRHHTTLEAKRLGHVELKCVGCKKETIFAPASKSGDWRVCGICHRATMFFA